jgi:hypothetical protein
MKFLIFTMATILSINTFAKDLDFKSLNQDDLKNICASSCGNEYASKVELRDFGQLVIYPDKVNQVGLTCFKKIEWQESGTPCHSREYYRGMHHGSLAPTKTEVHGGNWATKQGGEWCIAYNEEDFPGMESAIKSGQYKAGQVACVSGIKKGSL